MCKYNITRAHSWSQTRAHNSERIVFRNAIVIRRRVSIKRDAYGRTLCREKKYIN